jgi:phasin family protein
MFASLKNRFPLSDSHYAAVQHCSPRKQGELTMATQKISDFADLMKRLDPAALADQYKELLGKFSLPNLDTKALIETQSKNVQVLTDANRAILQSTQSLFQRQTEMVTQVLEEASEAVKSLSSATTPQEVAEKQIKMIEDSVSRALANFSEISEMVRKSRDETTKLVTDRFSENLAELRTNIAKLKKESK